MDELGSYLGEFFVFFPRGGGGEEDLLGSESEMRCTSFTFVTKFLVRKRRIER